MPPASEHAVLRQEANEAVMALFSDTSVSKAQTRESLGELKERIEELIEGLGDG